MLRLLHVFPDILQLIDNGGFCTIHLFRRVCCKCRIDRVPVCTLEEYEVFILSLNLIGSEIHAEFPGVMRKVPDGIRIYRDTL